MSNDDVKKRLDAFKKLSKFCDASRIEADINKRLGIKITSMVEQMKEKPELRDEIISSMQVDFPEKDVVKIWLYLFILPSILSETIAETNGELLKFISEIFH